MPCDAPVTITVFCVLAISKLLLLTGHKTVVSTVRVLRAIRAYFLIRDDLRSIVGSARRESAVDNQTVPCHKRRSSGTQPQNGLGNFLGPTDSPDGMQARKIVLFHIQAYDEPVDHLRIDHGWVDGG